MPAAFGEYLLRSRIADEKHARFYVGWVRRFLGRPAVVNNATPDEALTGFLGALDRDSREGWRGEKDREVVAAWRGWHPERGNFAPASKVILSPRRPLDAL